MTLLRQLAQAHAIGTDYVAFDGQPRDISDESLMAILAAMGVDASDEQAQQHALQQAEAAPWRRTVPGCTVAHQGEEKQVLVHVPHGSHVSVDVVHRQTGQRTPLEQLDHWVDPKQLDDELIGRATFAIPAGLALGWYDLRAHTVNGTVTGTVAITPQYARRRENAEGGAQQFWGGQVQLYATTSESSWGTGDFADLTLLAQELAKDGADFVLINPVHAANHYPQVTASPYSPTSRRFVDPMYLRPQACPEYTQLTPAARARVDALAAQAQQLNELELLDRDRAWALKSAALQLLYTEGMTRSRKHELETFQTVGGTELADFTAWFAEQAANHGAGTDEPTLLETDYHAWLQLNCREQLAQAQQQAQAAGMDLGVVHDLAVGVDSRSADADLLAAALVKGIHVGAPPDMFNQLGQDWGQPPWHPEELAAQGYKPFWDVIRSSIRDAGGLRIDHILGLFRLWWIPEGQLPGAGAYVYYDHEALIGLALLAAHESDAMLIGEDLGTFEPWVADYLASRGLLGTTIYFFEQDQGWPRDAAGYRTGALASVTTHDLPPAAGYLSGEHIRLRERLELLTTDASVEYDGLAAQRDGLIKNAQERGFLLEDYVFDADDEQSVQELMVACHRDMLRAPSQLLGVSVVDMVGQRIVQNQPGTSWQYPNWCVPVADAAGRRVPVERLRSQPQYQELMKVFAR
ncbi:4-alpha-glucanotransferase [Micrococcoides hystricis]|uniref:4-alpha-glucanotransferase n=1 Tax=Micrococcoides hystricis TaxID=1572761 RepID=A0ABV6PD42_9MICC